MHFKNKKPVKPRTPIDKNVKIMNLEVINEHTYEETELNSNKFEN